MGMEKGLNREEALKKLGKYGYNEIKAKSRISLFGIFFRQVRRNFVIYLLLVATFLAFFVGKNITGYSLIFVILVVVSVGFIQEYRAEKAISALKGMLVPVSIVIRDGKEREINSRELVPGDIVVLRNGEKVPADCLVLEQKELRVNESLLTGESREVEKKESGGKDVGDENMVFMGTFLVNGRCLARVVSTGMQTKFGKIAGMISEAEKELPLQDKVNKIAKYMAFIGILASLSVGIVMLLRATEINYIYFSSVLIVVIAVAVSSFPEGFPVVLIATLASGTRNMAKKNAIVNRMSIIETLGETTVICSDKTGTITKGEMTVKKVLYDNRLIDVSGAGYEATGDFFYDGKKIDFRKDEVLKLMLQCGVLCNDAIAERTGEDNVYRVLGSGTEGALIVLGAKAKVFKEDLNAERIEEIPFNSERKIMSVLTKFGNKNYVFSKGALEIVLNKCKFIRRSNGIFKLTERDRKKIVELNSQLTVKAYRTLSFAYKEVKSFKKDHLEEDLIFLGLVGMEDPPREEVKHALELCRTAGISVKMITGDSKETAMAVASQIGLSGNVLTGEELDKISDKKLLEFIDNVGIFARVKPEHKIRIVRVLKEKGEIVTMTGDGVNDAPALKEAHIGVAMGKGGTDVSRSVADLTLKDDNFSTIVDAVREGRTIFTNIQKFTAYQISINIAQVSLILLAVVIGLPVPLVAMQILFMNLLSDEITAITLGFNPASLDVMEIKPRKKSSLIDRKIIGMILIAGIIMSFVALGAFYYALNFMGMEEGKARTLAFATMILFGITNAFNFRSFRYPMYKLPIVTNKYLVYASALSLLATAIMIYSPIRKIFETYAINPFYLIIPFFLSFTLIGVFDFLKYKKAFH